MNHESIKNSKLAKELSNNTACTPDKYNKIKTKQITQFIIENDQDLYNCLDMLRYFMSDDIPKEVYEYLDKPDIDHDQIKKMLDKDFKDFFNERLNDYLLMKSAAFLNNYNKINKIPEKFSFGIKISSIHDLCLHKKYEGDNQFTTKEIKYFEDETLISLKKERPEWFNGGVYNVEEYSDLYDQYYDAIKWEYLCKEDEEIEKLKESGQYFENHYRILYDDIDIKNKIALDNTKPLDEQISTQILTDCYESIIHVNGFLVRQLGYDEFEHTILPKNNSKEGYFELYKFGLELVENGRINKSDFEWVYYDCDCEYR